MGVASSSCWRVRNQSSCTYSVVVIHSLARGLELQCHITQDNEELSVLVVHVLYYRLAPLFVSARYVIGSSLRFHASYLSACNAVTKNKFKTYCSYIFN